MVTKPTMSSDLHMNLNLLTSTHSHLHLHHHSTLHDLNNLTTPSHQRDEEECLLKFADSSLANDTSYCPVFWDGWGCWNYTRAGSRAYIPCPEHIKGFDTKLTASRECTEAGTWWTSTITNKTWSDYTSCVNDFELNLEKQVVVLYLFGYALSLVVLVTSLVIFALFNRQLKCDRVTLHRHLFICNLFNCVAWIIYYGISYFGLDIIAENSIYCRLLHIVSQYITVSMYLWMFCEGLYLHTVIVFGFTSGPKLLASCYIIGWDTIMSSTFKRFLTGDVNFMGFEHASIFPLITTCVYGSLRGQSEDTNDCWFHESKWSWINNGVVIFTFAANAIFLCNIIRVLITKLRAVNSSDANQVRKALRATMILVPLLGIQFIFFSSMPDENHSFKKVYQVLVALINSLQGFFLALLFCFLNGEVIQLLKRRAHTRSQQKSLRRRSSAHNSAICTAVSFPLNDLPQQHQAVINNNNSNNSSSKSRPSQSSVRKFRSLPKHKSSSLDDDDKRRQSSDCIDYNRQPLLKPMKVGPKRSKKGNIVSFNGAVNPGNLVNSTRKGLTEKTLKETLPTPSVAPPESARSF